MTVTVNDGDHNDSWPLLSTAFARTLYNPDCV